MVALRSTGGTPHPGAHLPSIVSSTSPISENPTTLKASLPQKGNTTSSLQIAPSLEPAPCIDGTVVVSTLNSSSRDGTRDTDAEPLMLSGSPHLIMSSGSQRPLVYRFQNKRLERLTDIPEAWDVYAVKHFTDAEDGIFACLVRYMGDSSLVRWNGSMFRQLQQLPSRGSHVFQPMMLGQRWHALLGNDFGYTWVYRLEKWKHWDIEETNDKEGPIGPLVPVQELKVLEARAFTSIKVQGRQLIFVASFGGDSLVFEYVEKE
ncbi:unnamed protein product [Ranitomeya imitator]|uniref:Uncharacterized protein n=1 Tax=Ranitomeya imitator TaxID=111125 RepID=A0ABN9KPX5_9NEOB|nr:unnamed protein product [Ranitomeya imitator]